MPSIKYNKIYDCEPVRTNNKALDNGSACYR